MLNVYWWTIINILKIRARDIDVLTALANSYNNLINSATILCVMKRITFYQIKSMAYFNINTIKLTKLLSIGLLMLLIKMFFYRISACHGSHWPKISSLNVSKAFSLFVWAGNVNAIHLIYSPRCFTRRNSSSDCDVSW